MLKNRNFLPFELMSMEKAREVWRAQTSALSVENHLQGDNVGTPVFSNGKGGRCWIDIVEGKNASVTIEVLEALFALGLPATDEDEIGFQWWRYEDIDKIDFTVVEEPDYTPMTLEQAKSVIIEKRNSYFNPVNPNSQTAKVELLGEHTVEELGALLLIWKGIPTNEPPTDD
jgi:hypothetical protein